MKPLIWFKWGFWRCGTPGFLVFASGRSPIVAWLRWRDGIYSFRGEDDY